MSGKIADTPYGNRMVVPNPGGGTTLPVESVVAGTNITVDNTDPQNPVVNGGSSLVLGSFADLHNADATSTFPCNGASHNAAVILAAPPDWMDDAGNIILPGLYVAGAVIGRAVDPAAPGLYFRAFGPFVASAIVGLDGLAVGSFAYDDVIALGDADLPYGTIVQFTGQNDVSATCTVRPFVARLI